MAVVINDFEVLPEAPAAAAPAAQPGHAETKMPPEQLEHLLRRLKEREERVRAD